MVLHCIISPISLAFWTIDFSPQCTLSHGRYLFGYSQEGMVSRLGLTGSLSGCPCIGRLSPACTDSVLFASHQHVYCHLAHSPQHNDVIEQLSDPDAESPLNCDAGNMIRGGDQIAFYTTAAMYTVENAHFTQWPPIQDEEEE